MTLRELITKIGFSVDTRGLQIYEKALGRIDDKLNGMFKTTDKVLNKMDSMGKSLSMKLSLPIAAVGTVSVMAAAKVEKYQTAFEVMTGSAEKASALMKELFTFEAKTPFNLEQTMDFAQQLLIAKQPLETITKEMMMLGNVAAGDSDRMKSIVYVLGQVRALGYLQGQDIMQFTNALVPIRAAIEHVTGKSGKALQSMIEKRQITAQITEKALQYVASSRSGMMERQATTVTGLFSSMTSAVFRLRAALGDILIHELGLKKLFVTIISGLNKVTEIIIKSPKWVKALAVALGGILFLIGPLLVGLAALGHAFIGLQMALVGLRMAGFLAQGQGLLALIPKVVVGIRTITASLWTMSAPILTALAGLATFFLLFRLVSAAIKTHKVISDEKKFQADFTARNDSLFAQKHPNMLYMGAAGGFVRPAAAGAGAGGGVVVHVHNPQIAVPEGTTQQQMSAIRAGAEASISDSVMNQIKKSLVTNIHGVIR